MSEKMMVKLLDGEAQNVENISANASRVLGKKVAAGTFNLDTVLVIEDGCKEDIFKLALFGVCHSDLSYCLPLFVNRKIGPGT